MKWFDLISNIGSTCGFVTGFSFVSVIEFIYFYTIKLFREIDNRRRQGKRIASETSTTTHFEPTKTNFKPISRYRPIYWNEIGYSTQLRHETTY
ncbi:unnamed protein product [Euphydryas editha]|nr:unnamed protein product [Euphydryas editha]